jgi:hypothetical protein
MVSAKPAGKCDVRRHEDLTPWVDRIAQATVSDSSQTSLVHYAAVRALWLRRTVAGLEARTVLSALCAAVSAARATGQRR